ncbi:diacylglycerol kinase family protein [Chitinophagaceae bacterium LB-8]|uniref:Diacylglycerol kinase family protein n=1 Tax=Paraflavisolibacter caeni TaxID=2982496 RepID=A0A9X2XTK7_9BACT|nr:diacylglycerol kinase family protein [Paraflavisolibacter caeni]MCU7547473.1 diacylglycerol kinase family protein [Paraflavisolibacter caeni]
MQDERQKLLFVINPVSGGKEKHNREAEIRNYFKNLPHTVEFYLLNGKSDKVSIQHHVKSANPDKIIAVGGDGTVKLLADMLKGTDHILGIIPAGSANGMAKELNIPINMKEALDIIVHGQPQLIDAILINKKEICLHLSDMGLNAMMVKYFHGYNKRGMWGYARSIFRVLWEKQKIYATIITDNVTIKRKAYMIVLANASQYGTGASINPSGKLDDGLFEIVVVRKLHLWTILKMLLKHKTFDTEKIEIIHTKKVTLTSLRKSYFQVDGEYRGRLREIRAEIYPHCINLMLPRNSIV